MSESQGRAELDRGIILGVTDQIRRPLRHAVFVEKLSPHVLGSRVPAKFRMVSLTPRSLRAGKPKTKNKG
jgi:hypothetical protein